MRFISLGNGIPVSYTHLDVYKRQHFFALVGFRHIDDIMEKETTIQNQLKQALDETRLSNEIISAIAKSYCSIYRIDVQKDFFEEVSNDSEIHKLTGNRGSASEKLYQLSLIHI